MKDIMMYMGYLDVLRFCQKFTPFKSTEKSDL